MSGYIVISKNETDKEMLIEVIRAESYNDARRRSVENAGKRGVSQGHIMTIAVPEGYTTVLTAEDMDNTAVADYWHKFNAPE